MKKVTDEVCVDFTLRFHLRFCVFSPYFLPCVGIGKSRPRSLQLGPQLSQPAQNWSTDDLRMAQLSPQLLIALLTRLLCIFLRLLLPSPRGLPSPTTTYQLSGVEINELPWTMTEVPKEMGNVAFWFSPRQRERAFHLPLDQSERMSPTPEKEGRRPRVAIRFTRPSLMLAPSSCTVARRRLGIGTLGSTEVPTPLATSKPPDDGCG